MNRQVKTATLKEVSQWLVVIRTNTVAIGRAALRKCTNYMTGQVRPTNLFTNMIGLV